MDLDMQNTSTYIDQDYKVSVMKFSKKDAIKDNAEKLLDIGLMTMKVCTSKTFSTCFVPVIPCHISTKLQVYA